MLRNFTNFDVYLNNLLGDVYEQPPDEVHTRLTRKVIREWVSVLDPCMSVLDVGCGNGFAEEIFSQEIGIPRYEGVCLGEDYLVAKEKGISVRNEDFSFLSVEDDWVDLVFARHALEHSPMPIPTLMEWHRVTRNWLCVIVPDIDFWGVKSPNHYSIAPIEQVESWIERAGFKIVWDKHILAKNHVKRCGDKDIFEHWFMGQKMR